LYCFHLLFLISLFLHYYSHNPKYPQSTMNNCGSGKEQSVFWTAQHIQGSCLGLAAHSLPMWHLIRYDVQLCMRAPNQREREGEMAWPDRVSGRSVPDYFGFWVISCKGGSSFKLLVTIHFPNNKTKENIRFLTQFSNEREEPHV
jgi:hypothetical protein